jgi:hypothetical protein
MTNLQLKEVAKEATNKDFYNQFATASKVTSLIGYFGQLISALTEFHFVFSALGGVYDSIITLKSFLAFVGGIVAVYIFEVVGVRIYLVKIIRQIVNKDFKGSERKVLFLFNLLFVLALCGTNLLTSWLGQKYSFATITNVTTTDKTHKLETQKSNEVATVTARYDDKKNDLQTTYNNEVATVTARYDNDIKELKNSRYTHRENKTKYNSYTAKIDTKINEKTTDLSTLKTQFDSNIIALNNERNSEINERKQMFTTRINDVSNVENSKINLIATVQKYTLPILIIFILLSWFAIVYNEIFLKGSGQKIEVIEVEKRPVLILELLTGLYDKIYQMFYWIVAKFLGSKQYEFGAIKQDVVKYDIQNATIKNTVVNDYTIAANNQNNNRPIGYYGNGSDNQSNNKKTPINSNQNGSNTGVQNFDNFTPGYPQNGNDFNDSNAMNFKTDDNRITKVVTVQNLANRTCKNCGNGFTYKHHKQMYCSTECRIENWENRTGKTLKKKAKK